MKRLHTFSDVSVLGESRHQGLLIGVEAEASDEKFAFVIHLLRDENKKGHMGVHGKREIIRRKKTQNIKTPKFRH